MRFDGSRWRAGRASLGVVALALTAAVAASGPVAAAGWSTPGNLSVAGNDSLYRQTDATAASGDVLNVLLWNEGSVVQLRSPDAGSTWGGIATLGQASGSLTFEPRSMASSGTRVIALLVSSTSGGTRKLLARVSTDGGQSFGAAKTIASYTDASNNMGYASAAVSGTRAVIAWSDRRNGKIYVRRSIDGGATWKPAALVGTSTAPFTSGKDASVDAAMVGAKVFLAWHPGRDSSGAKALTIRRSLDGGASWKPAQTISTLGQAFPGPSVSASGSSVLILFAERSGTGSQTVRVARSTDSGASFAKATVVPSTADYPQGWDIAIVGKQARLTFTTGQVVLHSRSSSDGGKTWAVADDLGGAQGIDANVTISPSATTVVFGEEGEFDANAFVTRQP